jgi:Protein of unknown function (DUF4238)
MSDVADPIFPSEPILQGAKRQHFLPRFYLERFCRNGFLSLFDRETHEYRTQQPSNTGVISHLYTFEDEQGRKRFDVEELFARIEGAAASGIECLARKLALTDEQRARVLLFIAFARSRTPEAITTVKSLTGDIVKQVTKFAFKDVERVQEILKEDNGLLSHEEQLARAKAQIDFAQSGNYDVSVNDTFALQLALSLASPIIDALKTRIWTVLHPERPRDSFVTTDTPLVLTYLRTQSPYGVGFGSPNAIVYFPLGQDACLMFHGEGTALKHRNIPQNQVASVNRMLTANCQRFVIGRDESLIKSLVRNTGIDKTNWTPPYQFW